MQSSFTSPEYDPMSDHVNRVVRQITTNDIIYETRVVLNALGLLQSREFSEEQLRIIRMAHTRVEAAILFPESQRIQKSRY
jgi:hypothetical protein